MSNPLPNPCQPATSYPGAEFDAEMADDEARYPVPHVHRWFIETSESKTFRGGICLDCGARLQFHEINALLNKYAQDYGLGAVQMAAPAVLTLERMEEYFAKMITP